MAIAEADDNLRNAEEEGLDPEFEELTLVFEHVFVVVDFGRGFKLDPFDRLVRVAGFAVPYWSGH